MTPRPQSLQPPSPDPLIIIIIIIIMSQALSLQEVAGRHGRTREEAQASYAAKGFIKMFLDPTKAITAATKGRGRNSSYMYSRRRRKRGL